MSLKKEADNYISLQEAAKYCRYSQEYLSLRARQGKLRAVKLGRNWVTKKEWLEEYITQIEEYNKDSYYISLQEASKYYAYSQEYLSLRARQGKLRAVKLGRNWVTKKEWLEEYLAEVEEYKESLKVKEVREVKEVKKVERKVLPPENLPVGKLDEREFAKIRPLPLPVFRFGFAFGLVLVLLVTGVIFGRTFLENVFEDIYALGKAGDVIEGTSESVKSLVVAIGKGGASISTDPLGTFKKYGQWVGDQVFTLGKGLKRIPEKFVQGFKLIAKLWQKPEKIVEEPIIPEPGEKEGMVVIPSTEEDELIKERIKLAFSDEVRIEPEDRASGIIIPIFKKKEGEEYMYVLVPVKEEN